LLLVEDNEELARATQALLESFGCKVQRVRNAGEALQAVGTDRGFDVVLSDVVMPGEVDGVQLARQLLRLFPRLPVVLISGFSPALAGDHGFVVLHKPCTPEVLVAALRQAIEGAGLAGG
jgi:CheY-like chemotaxis protein